MTEQEAIQQLKFDMEMITFDPNTGEYIPLEVLKTRNDDNYKTYLADELAIKALEEIQKYRANGTPEELKQLKENGAFTGLELAQLAAMQMKLKEYQSIGTVEECRKAREKQTAKKPDYEGDGYADGHLVYDAWICPCCEEQYEVDYDDYEHCPNCGQAIDWSEEK